MPGNEPNERIVAGLRDPTSATPETPEDDVKGESHYMRAFNRTLPGIVQKNQEKVAVRKAEVQRLTAVLKGLDSGDNGNTAQAAQMIADMEAPVTPPPPKPMEPAEKSSAPSPIANAKASSLEYVDVGPPMPDDLDLGAITPEQKALVEGFAARQAAESEAKGRSYNPFSDEWEKEDWSAYAGTMMASLLGNASDWNTNTKSAGDSIESAQGVDSAARRLQVSEMEAKLPDALQSFYEIHGIPAGFVPIGESADGNQLGVDYWKAVGAIAKRDVNRQLVAMDVPPTDDERFEMQRLAEEDAKFKVKTHFTDEGMPTIYRSQTTAQDIMDWTPGGLAILRPLAGAYHGNFSTVEVGGEFFGNAPGKRSKFGWMPWIIDISEQLLKPFAAGVMTESDIADEARRQLPQWLGDLVPEWDTGVPFDLSSKDAMPAFMGMRANPIDQHSKMGGHMGQVMMGGVEPTTPMGHWLKYTSVAPRTTLWPLREYFGSEAVGSVAGVGLTILVTVAEPDPISIATGGAAKVGKLANLTKLTRFTRASKLDALDAVIDAKKLLDFDVLEADVAQKATASMAAFAGDTPEATKAAWAAARKTTAGSDERAKMTFAQRESLEELDAAKEAAKGMDWRGTVDKVSDIIGLDASAAAEKMVNSYMATEAVKSDVVNKTIDSIAASVAKGHGMVKDAANDLKAAQSESQKLAAIHKKSEGEVILRQAAVDDAELKLVVLQGVQGRSKGKPRGKLEDAVKEEKAAKAAVKKAHTDKVKFDKAHKDIWEKWEVDEKTWKAEGGRLDAITANAKLALDRQKVALNDAEKVLEAIGVPIPKGVKSAYDKAHKLAGPDGKVKLEAWRKAKLGIMPIHSTHKQAKAAKKSHDATVLSGRVAYKDTVITGNKKLGELTALRAKAKLIDAKVVGTANRVMKAENRVKNFVHHEKVRAVSKVIKGGEESVKEAIALQKIAAKAAGVAVKNLGAAQKLVDKGGMAVEFERIRKEAQVRVLEEIRNGLEQGARFRASRNDSVDVEGLMGIASTTGTTSAQRVISGAKLQNGIVSRWGHDALAELRRHRPQSADRIEAYLKRGDVALTSSAEDSLKMDLHHLEASNNLKVMDSSSSPGADAFWRTMLEDPNVSIRPFFPSLGRAEIWARSAMRRAAWRYTTTLTSAATKAKHMIHTVEAGKNRANRWNLDVYNVLAYSGIKGLMKLMTTTEPMVVLKGATIYNTGNKTVMEKFLLRVVAAAELNKAAKKDKSLKKLIADMPDLTALVRMTLRNAKDYDKDKDKLAVYLLMNKITKAYEKGPVTPEEVLQMAADATAATLKGEDTATLSVDFVLKQDRQVSAFAAAIGHGAVLYDMSLDTRKAMLAMYTPQDAKDVMNLMNGAHDQVVDAERALSILSDFGSPLTRRAGEVKESEVMREIVAIGIGPDGEVLMGLKAHIDDLATKLSGYTKELEAYPTQGDSFVRKLGRDLKELMIGDMVRGSTHPKPAYFVKSHLQNASQVAFTEGYTAALKGLIRNVGPTAMFVPPASLRAASAKIQADMVARLPESLKKYAVLPGFMQAMLNPRTKRIYDGGADDDIITVMVNGVETTYTGGDVRRMAAEMGVMENAYAKEFEHIIGKGTWEARYGDGAKESFRGQMVNALPSMARPHTPGDVAQEVSRAALHHRRAIDNVFDHVEQYQRFDLFLDLITKGVPPKDAAKRTKAALYDWQHALNVAEEGNILAQFIPFYRVFSNMGKQMLRGIVAPLTDEFSETFAKGMTGRTGLRRIGSYQNLTDATNEFSETELQEGDVRQRFPDIGDSWVRPVNPSYHTNITLEEQAYFEERLGKRYDRRVNVLPPGSPVEAFAMATDIAAVASGFLTAAVRPDVDIRAGMVRDVGESIVGHSPIGTKELLEAASDSARMMKEGVRSITPEQAQTYLALSEVLMLPEVGPYKDEETGVMMMNASWMKFLRYFPYASQPLAIAAASGKAGDVGPAGRLGAVIQDQFYAPKSYLESTAEIKDRRHEDMKRSIQSAVPK